MPSQRKGKSLADGRPLSGSQSLLRAKRSNQALRPGPPLSPCRINTKSKYQTTLSFFLFLSSLSLIFLSPARHQALLARHPPHSSSPAAPRHPPQTPLHTHASPPIPLEPPRRASRPVPAVNHAAAAGPPLLPPPPSHLHTSPLRPLPPCVTSSFGLVKGEWSLQPRVTLNHSVRIPINNKCRPREGVKGRHREVGEKQGMPVSRSRQRLGVSARASTRRKAGDRP